MKPREKKPETVYRIIDRSNGCVQGSYSRAYCDEYDFNSCSEARTANCHGMFEDKAKYKIAKYRVTYELIEEDVDPKKNDENTIIGQNVKKGTIYLVSGLHVDRFGDLGLKLAGISVIDPQGVERGFSAVNFKKIVTASERAEISMECPS